MPFQLSVIAALGPSSTGASSGMRSSVSPAGAGDGPGGLAVGVPFGEHLALVVGLAAAGQGELDLGPAVLEVEPERHQREVLLVDDVAQPVDLRPVEQQLAAALGLVPGVVL